METVRVMVVDDHSLFRRGIVAVLDAADGLDVVGEAVDGLDAIAKARELVPDVIVMDLHMPNCSGLEATQALQTEFPQINILVLTVSEMEADLFSAIRYGARGYLLKKTDPEDLVEAIFLVANGGAIVSPLMATSLLTEFKSMTATGGGSASEAGRPATGEVADNLSPRETEVLQLVAQGKTNREIAEALFISENTVKTHLRSIMEKLHLANRSQAAAYAARRGLAPPQPE
jgi:DNA-binding NarL/FixJ family response regulator